MQTLQKKNLSNKWRTILESNLGRPIRTRAEASVIATLLENQNKVNQRLC